MRRAILRRWAVFIRSEITRVGGLEPHLYDWALGAVPSSHVLKRFLIATKSLFVSRKSQLEKSLARVDGSAIRLDGHFKLPREIVLLKGNTPA